MDVNCAIQGSAGLVTGQHRILLLAVAFGLKTNSQQRVQHDRENTCYSTKEVIANCGLTVTAQVGSLRGYFFSE